MNKILKILSKNMDCIGNNSGILMEIKAEVYLLIHFLQTFYWIQTE